MSSDSELVPSPLPSPIFSRCSPARCTVARRCREFYLRRLERTATMQKRWSLCVPDSEVDQAVPVQNGNSASDILNEEVASAATQGSDAVANGPTNSVTQELPGHHPLRKCRSSLDLAMDSLRKEISSLIAQDNDLFRQLLSLHDSIAELRERQRSCFSLCPDEGDEEDGEEDDEADDGDREDSHSPSLESLSDPGDQETSPDSTLSSRSSLSATSPSHHHLHHHHHHPHHHHPARYQQRLGDGGKKRHRAATVGNNDSRPLVFVNKNEFCWRCRKVPPPYRRASSISSLYWLHEDMDSYDSGIHLQGSHSDSDHEIFV